MISCKAINGILLTVKTQINELQYMSQSKVGSYSFKR